MPPIVFSQQGKGPNAGQARLPGPLRGPSPLGTGINAGQSLTLPPGAPSPQGLGANAGQALTIPGQGSGPNAGQGLSPPGAVHAPTPATPGPPAASPLDSTYYGNVAAHQFATNNSINALNLNNAEQEQALQAALAQLAYAQPRAQLAAEQRANQRGALYSSVYGQQLGDLNYKFLGQQGGAEQKYGNAELGNASKIAALKGGEPLYDAQQYAAAALRASAQAQKNPALGLSTAPLVPAKPNGPGLGDKQDRGGAKARLARAIVNKDQQDRNNLDRQDRGY